MKVEETRKTIQFLFPCTHHLPPPLAVVVNSVVQKEGAPSGEVETYQRLSLCQEQLCGVGKSLHLSGS